MNQGKLVPDEIIVNLLSEHLKNGEAKGESGFILDGFPRTIRQAVSKLFTLVKSIDGSIIFLLSVYYSSFIFGCYSVVGPLIG